jgi:hypothetical protein
MKSVKISLEGTIPVLIVYLVEVYRRNLLSVELAEIGFGIDGPVVSECVCVFFANLPPYSLIQDTKLHAGDGITISLASNSTILRTSNGVVLNLITLHCLLLFAS